MKTTALLSSAVALAAGGLLAAGTVSLNGDWSLKAFPQPDDGAIRTLPLPDGIDARTVAAQVPGCCEEDLMRAGLLPDPMVSTNAFAWWAFEGHQWLYAKTFDAPARAPGERAVLVFDGIDTLADIFLNGEKIGEADNMLIPHEFDVTGKLREGAANTVQVLIRPVGLAAADVSLGELGYTMSGGANHEHFRKAPYMYGWDTLPHLAVSGLWRDVRLEVRPAARVEEPVWIVRGLDAKARTASLLARARIPAPFRHFHKARVRCTLSRGGKVVAAGARPYMGPHCSVGLTLRNAELWWPRGAGAQPLYDAAIELVAADGAVLARDTRRIGIRTVALEYDDRKLPERPGRFLFKVNGEPIYIRGVDWIPLDPIPSRQKAQLGRTLPMMADLNCNLVRVWGGGVYEPDEFFDWCDENGVLVWQDFMMACTLPPMNDDFAKAIEKEVRAIVIRHRNHPSIALWAGDNENDLAGGWGLGRKLMRDPNANRITRKTIPDVLNEYDVTRPYLPSSPYVSTAAFKGEVEPCEDHLWNGPRAWWKTAYYTNNACWFCSEGGAHALPARSTIEKMIPAEDIGRIWSNPDAKDWRKLDWTPQWRYRATCPNLEPGAYPWNRNELILKQTAALFGDVPRHDLDLFIAQSQSAQVEGIKFQVELFRSQKFTKKGGFVVWNLRDGWPTISDAVCDSFGTRKKSYYALKAAYRNVLPIVTEDRRLVVVNDGLAPAKGRVTVVEAATGATVLEKDYEAPANGILELARLSWDGQGLFRIAYTADGETFRTHYLHGEPPFRWSDYAAWTKE